MRDWVESAHIQNGIVALIVLNAILLGLETWPGAMARAGNVISAIDRTILGVFVVKLMIRLYVHRSGFWRDPWSVFDFLVVAVALIPASGSFAVLRALRVLRVLRLLTMMPSMRRVVGALLKAIPGSVQLARYCSFFTMSLQSLRPIFLLLLTRNGLAMSVVHSIPSSRS